MDSWQSRDSLPAISIITAVYNDPRVERALDSLLSQDLPESSGLELIVVDGGSTDGTLDVLKGYGGQIGVFISERDEGIYDAMNKGIARASGDVIGILNADDRYADVYVLRDVLQAFDDHEVLACYGDLVYVDDNDRVVRYWRSGEHRRAKWYAGWMPAHPTFFVRREVYERYGVFDTQYRIAADYELMLRLLVKRRVKAAYIDRVMVRMANGGHSNRSAGNVLQAAREVRRAWQNNGLAGGQLAPVLKPAQKVFQFVRRPEAGEQ